MLHNACAALTGVQLNHIKIMGSSSFVTGLLAQLGGAAPAQLSDRKGVCREDRQAGRCLLGFICVFKNRISKRREGINFIQE